jgi:hypothetical protein
MCACMHACMLKGESACLCVHTYMNPHLYRACAHTSLHVYMCRNYATNMQIRRQRRTYIHTYIHMYMQEQKKAQILEQRDTSPFYETSSSRHIHVHTYTYIHTYRNRKRLRSWNKAILARSMRQVVADKGLRQTQMSRHIHLIAISQRCVYVCMDVCMYETRDSVGLKCHVIFV